MKKIYLKNNFTENFLVKLFLIIFFLKNLSGPVGMFINFWVNKNYFEPEAPALQGQCSIF